MQGKNLHHAKPRLNRAESMTIFKRLLEGHYGSSTTTLSNIPGEATVPVHDEKYRLRMDVLGLTGGRRSRETQWLDCRRAQSHFG